MHRTIKLQKTIGRGTSSWLMTSVRQRSTTAFANSAAVDQVKPFEEMPGPKPLPIIGNIWRFLPVIGQYTLTDIYATQKKMQEKYGNIVRLSGIPRRPAIVFTFNPHDAETMYRNEGQYPLRPMNASFGHYYEHNKNNLTGGRRTLISAENEEWQSLRRAVQQPIMQPRTAKMYISSVEEVANEFMQRIRAMRDSKHEMPDNFHNELFKWSLESIGLIALDTRLGCLTPNLPSNSETRQMIDAVDKLFEVFPRLELGSPLWKYFNTPNWIQFEKSMDTFTSLAVKYISQAVENMKNRSEELDDEPTLIQRLLKRNNSDPTMAVLVALDLLLGGIDTTSLTSANLLYLLAKNPNKQKKLLDEIIQVLPTKDTRVTAESLNDMKYLRACLKEALRVVPLVVAGARILAKDVVLSGYNVPKGTTIFSGLAVMGDDSRNFPMAGSFIPERWLKGNNSDCPISKEEQNKVHPFSTLPFGHGPRMCIGRRFAEMEIQMLVLKVIQNFEVEFNYKTRFSTANNLFYTLEGPMKFTFKDRKGIK